MYTLAQPLSSREGARPISQKDPRVVRTNERLRQALSTLLQQQSLKQISVQKLTQKAQITRGTFYLHYKDKLDFLEQTEQQVIDEWFATAKTTTITPQGDPTNGFALGPALRYVDEHHQILLVLLHPQFTQFQPRLLQRFERELLAYGRQLPAPAGDEPPVDIQAAYLATAFTGLVHHWLNDNRRYRPEFLARTFCQLLAPETTPLATWFAPVGIDSPVNAEKA